MYLQEFFSINPKTIQPFNLFGKEHILALLCIIIFISTLTLLSRNNEKIRSNYRLFLLFSIPTQEVIFKFWAGVINGIDLEILFSLHLCSICIGIIIIILIKYNQNMFEILYFWGLGGATQALITPDISVYGFPHFRFFQVFLSHGLIIASVIYFIFVVGKRIRKGALKRIIIFTNIYVLIIFIINSITGTNYLFINHKPETASIIDTLGPWPEYLIWMELFMIVIFSLLYIPIYLSNKKIEKKKERTQTA